MDGMQMIEQIYVKNNVLVHILLILLHGDVYLNVLYRNYCLVNLLIEHVLIYVHKLHMQILIVNNVYMNVLLNKKLNINMIHLGLMILINV